MGTIPRSSSHSPLATEAAYGVGLLLFWPAALQVLRSVFATPGFPVLPVTADPSGCPFVPVFRQDIPGRSVLQALGADTPEGFCSLISSIRGRSPSVS